MTLKTVVKGTGQVDPSRSKNFTPGALSAGTVSVAFGNMF